MTRLFAASLLLLLIPVGAGAAPIPAAIALERSVLVASSTPGNAYALGLSTLVTAPIKGDLTALGGSVVVTGPVGGDALLIGGSVHSRVGVGGDVRAIGGSVDISEPIQGDLMALAYAVHDVQPIRGNVLIAAENVQLTGGVSGPVTIYGNRVDLAGEYLGDVHIVATGSIQLAASTTIHGTLSYEAPEVAFIPSSATIAGGITYSNSSIMPSGESSRAFAIIGVGLFLLVRILGALILAGLFAGFFPRLATALNNRLHAGRTRSILLTMLLGFAAIVATPILLILLALTFVGLGIAVLLGLLYIVLIIISAIYGGILVGVVTVQYFTERSDVRWSDGVIGMFVLSLITLIPIIGPAIAFFLMLFTAGSLILLFFQLAFPQEDSNLELV